MKLHRHTSHENDDMTTHKWPQFVPDDVKQDDIYVMNEYICIHCRNSLRQKECLTRHVQIVYSCMTGSTEHTAIGEKTDFSTNPIHNNTYHETIWWPSQS